MSKKGLVDFNFSNDAEINPESIPLSKRTCKKPIINNKLYAELTNVDSSSLRMERFFNNNINVRIVTEFVRRHDALINPYMRELAANSALSMVSKLDGQSRIIYDYFKRYDSFKFTYDFSDNYKSRLFSLASQNSKILNSIYTTLPKSKLLHAVKSLYNKALTFENDEFAIDYISEVLSNGRLELIDSIQDYDVLSYKEELLKIDNITNESEFRDSLSSLPDKFKSYVVMVFLRILLSTFLSLALCVAGNLITPIIQDYLGNSNKTNKEKIHDIKRLIAKDIDKSQVRFITKDIVYLREKPSKKSNVIDELAFGQVVTVHSKNKNWIEVSYQYESGEVVIGWVFNSYTARFK